MAACTLFRKSLSVFFEYDTLKVVHIRSKAIGITNKLVQLAIVAYIIVWVLILNKGYQRVDVGVSGTTTKVKGVAHSNLTDDPRVGARVWDAADIVVPAEENNAFFITTNLIETVNQSLGVCAEDPAVKAAYCFNNTDCPQGKAYLLGHGVATGECNNATHTCDIHAWCPLEDDHMPLNGTRPALIGTEDFTVLIKNHVYFPYYEQTRSNIIESSNKTYLAGCQYHSASDALCPVFRLEYVVNEALKKNGGSGRFEDMAVDGGVIAIRIRWNCNFDLAAERCQPVYDFDRLDKGDDSLIAKGYNYRYVNKYTEGGIEKRTLVKAFGILFIISVNAKAGKFNVIPTLENIGSGIALLAIATVVCDLFVLYIHKRKLFFRDHKYEQVKTDDEYQPMD